VKVFRQFSERTFDSLESCVKVNFGFTHYRKITSPWLSFISIGPARRVIAKYLERGENL
jgi:uncharacterized protein YecE (DUF72 family)